MKKLILIALLAILCSLIKAHAQIDSIPKINGEYTYQEVVKAESFKKDNFYKNAKVYFVDNFKSAKDVIQYDDKVEGKIIGKGFFSISETSINNLLRYTIKWDVYYSTEIVCKDGKYRYRFYDIKISQNLAFNNEIGSSKYITIDTAYSQSKKKLVSTTVLKLCNRMSQTFKQNCEILKQYMNKNQSLAKDDF